MILLLVITGSVFYSFAFWTSDVTKLKDLDFSTNSTTTRYVLMCAPKRSFAKLVDILNNMDTFLSLICPSIIIICLNIRVALQIRSVTNQAKRDLQSQDSKDEQRAEQRRTSGDFAVEDGNRRQKNRNKWAANQCRAMRVRAQAQLRTTRMLLGNSKFTIIYTKYFQ